MTAKDRVSQVNCIVFKKEKDSYRFLVLKRREDRGGFWQSITGGVKLGEEIISAVKRELMEETGIENCIRLIDLDYSFSFTSPPFGELMENCFAVEILSEVEIIMSHEHTEHKWLPLNGAIGLLKYDSNKEAFRRLDQKINLL